MRPNKRRCTRCSQVPRGHGLVHSELRGSAMSDSVIVAVKTLAVALTGAAVLTTAALNQDVIGDAARVGDLSAMGILGLLDLLLIAAVLVLWRALDKSRDKTETRADEARQRYETLMASLVAA